ncbi:MAG TPA: methyltransferase, TIGR04325 family [Candidatus Acidoferrales bacterium]|nr:methyltransferase, TIGR04325 family [Candidatus Acidoferrales bacterium]
MAAASRLKRLAYQARHVPLVGGVVAGAYRRHFESARGKHVRLFHGVYPTFAAAANAIPPGGLAGYDNEPSATRVLDEWLDVYASDYPVMFWLEKLLREARFVFDWGGNVGLKYFAFRRYLDYPAALTWLVAEVPAIAELGAQIARRESAEALRFTTELDELPRADILLAAGALHFIEEPFERLRAAPQLPRHLLLNKVPAYAMPSAVTLHNMGTAFCPYHLFNRDELVHVIESLGYELVDEWRSPDLGCEIPFSPDHSIGAYSGFYFTKSR